MIPENDVLSAALERFFDRPMELRCPELEAMYQIQQAFGGNLPYWAEDLRSVRFEKTITEGILYRPEIVSDLCSHIETALNSPLGKGIMVKGLQGIGKSHSLVSTVLKLESTGNYLVTFIPDCDQWNTGYQLYVNIFASFGSSVKDLGLDHNQMLQFAQSEDNLLSLLDEIDVILKGLGKKWVFVFDQINRLFAKSPAAKDAGTLPFPYDMIARVRKIGRITSVISASANNEMAYKERHEGFDEYVHRNDMTTTELHILFPEIEENSWETILGFTGGVPMYVALFLGTCQSDDWQFQNEIYEAVTHSLIGLETNSTPKVWNQILESVFRSFMGSGNSDELDYDKKFFIESKRGHVCYYKALMPSVLAACRHYLWKELMEYIADKEGNLVDVCEMLETTNDVRGRCFELMVVRRCMGQGVTFQVGREEVTVPVTREPLHFQGQVLPRSLKDGVHVPVNSNFPAIDLVWKVGNRIFGVQVHVSSHHDVAEKFTKMCQEAGWFETFQEVHLIYLSPDEQVLNLVTTLVNPPKQRVRCTTSNESDLHRRAISKNSISCLENLRWPEGCSIRV